MKQNNKINKIIILAVIGLTLTVTSVIFILNYTKDDYSFSILEKNWISNNKNKVLDISVYNDVPVYGLNGEGIAFSYLNNFTTTYGIDFNKVSYLNETKENLKSLSFKVVDFDESLTNDDILIEKDYYVIVSKENEVLNDIEDTQEISLGVLDSDLKNVKYYLEDSTEITYVSCANFDDMLKEMNDGTIKYMVIPQNLYLDEILSNELSIVYHMSELYKKYVITIKGDNTLKNIIDKTWLLYNDSLKKEDYKKHYLNTIFKNQKISEAEKMGYNSTPYTYGFVTNMPYENMINKEFAGILSNYLSDFSELTDVDFKIVGYNSVLELKDAFSKGEVDVLFGNFDTTGVNVDILPTVSPMKEEYVILSQEPFVVNSIRSLKGKSVYTVNNTYLYDYLNTNGITIKGYNNTDDLLRNINKDSIILMDKSTYEYYKDKKFSNYYVLYQNDLNEEYQFLVRDVNKNTTFYKLFNYYVSDINYKSIMYNYNTNYMINSKNELSTMLKYLFIILGIAAIGIGSVLVFFKLKNKKDKINKEDKLKFIDVMTSLKNRNYLNYNIKKWDENVIYPQAIVIIDLNNLKYINDNYGHEEGDEVIKKAASILIINQLENTDVMRTDGNEFLVYMVGYEEKKVQEYTRKINKELKNLPHEFGAAIGYSMIEDDIKTIDDAINEATLSMRQAKEK